DRNERENDFPLRGGPNAGEGSVQRPAFSSRLLENIEVSQQRHAVTIHVEHATSKSTNSGITVSVVTFAELQCHLVPTIGDGHRVREMAPPLAGVERHIRWH